MKWRFLLFCHISMSKPTLKFAATTGALASVFVFSGCVALKTYAIKSDDTLKDFPTFHIVKYVAGEYGTVMAAMSGGYGFTVCATIMNPAAAVGVVGAMFGLGMLGSTLPWTGADRVNLLQPLHPPHPELR
jgi:hypothetical protein